MSSPRLDGLSAAPPAARPKGPYLCKTCGKPKRGHQCIGEQTISQEGQQEDVNKENDDKSAPSSDAVPSTTMVVEEGAVVHPHVLDNPSKEPQQENNSSSVAPPAAAATGEAQQGDPQFSKKQYLCGLCGQPKKGHKCTADRVISATMLAALPTTATPAAGGEAAAPPPRGRGRPPKRAAVETEEEEREGKTPEKKNEETPATETPAAKRGRGRPKKSEGTGASPVAEKEEQREEEQMKDEEEESNDVTTTEAPAVKRGRGRPRKNEGTTASHVVEEEKEKAEKNEEGPSADSAPAKRGRGRPPKKSEGTATSQVAEEKAQGEEKIAETAKATTPIEPTSSSTPAKRGRGRPKKSEQTTAPSLQDDETNEQANDTPVKKGRGRPKKRLESSSSSSSSESEKSANEMEQQSTQLPTKRGRGRPRKNEKKTKDTKKSKRDSMKKEDEEDVEEPSIAPFLALLPRLPQAGERTERLSAPERRAKAAREAEEAKKAKAAATNLTTAEAHSETKTEDKKVYLCSRCGEPKKGHVCNDPVEVIVESSENEEESEGGGKSSKKRKGRRHVDHNNKPKEITKGVKQKTFARVLIGDLLNIPTSWRLDSLPLTQVSARPKLDAAATPLFPRWSTAPVLVENVSLYHPSAVTSPPISIDDASPVSLPRFKCVPRKNGGCVLNCGGPVSALDWLERPLESAADAHFLAVAVLQTMDESHRIGRRYEGANMVQLWQCSSSPSSGITASFAGGIAHNGGFVIDLAWCPQSTASSLPTPRLGLLAACLGDGRIVVWSVPVPQQDKAAPIWNLKPVLEISCPPSATFSALRWAPASANCAVLLTSRTDGGVQLWNLLHAHDDKDDNNNISPIFNTPHHKSFVHAISFCPSSSLSNIRFASAGAEGTVNVWSAQEPCRATATFHITTPVADLFWANNETCCIAPEEAALGVFDVNVDDDVSFWPAHDAAVTRIDGQPDKPMLASASRDGTIQLYALRKQPQPKCVFRLSVADSPQGSYAVDSKAAAAKAETHTPTPGTRQYFPSPSIATTAVRWNPNPSASSWLAAGTALGLVALLNTKSS